MGLERGDTVHWNTPQGTTTGTCRQKRVTDFEFDGQHFRPTDDDPYWIVESEKSGAEAAHKESSLTKA